MLVIYVSSSIANFSRPGVLHTPTSASDLPCLVLGSLVGLVSCAFSIQCNHERRPWSSEGLGSCRLRGMLDGAMQASVIYMLVTVMMSEPHFSNCASLISVFQRSCCACRTSSFSKTVFLLLADHAFPLLVLRLHSLAAGHSE